MCQLEIYRAGEDIRLLVEPQTSGGDAINIDDLTELYVYIVGPTGATKARFSKSGVDIGDKEFTALEKITSFSYALLIDSALTKEFIEGIYVIEVNLVGENTSLIDNKQNDIGRKKIFVIENTNIKELS